MIIYGTKVQWTQERLDEHFYCPNCQTEQPATRDVSKRYFTVFFIPIFPFRTLSERITCPTCLTRYHPDILLQQKRKAKPKRAPELDE